MRVETGATAENATADRTVQRAVKPTGRRTLRALGNPNYRLYFFGQFVSQTGSWLQRTAQAWLVLVDLHGSPADLGLLTALQFAPIMVLTLFAGVIADRLPKRRLMFVIQMISTVQASVMAILTLTGVVQLWHVYVLAFILGLVSAFDFPTRQSFVSELVSREELQSAIGLNSSVFNGARIIGPGMGGLVIAAVGSGWCFALNAVSFLAVLISLAMLDTRRLHEIRRAPRAAMWTQLADGLRYAAGHPRLSFAIGVLAFIGTFGYNFGVVLPLLATQALGLDSVGFGSLNAAMGIGALIAALGVVARLTPSDGKVLGAGGMFSALLLVAAFAPYPVVLVVLVLLGVANVTYSAMTNTTLQLNSDEAYRGRVLSLYTLLFAGTTPIGGALTGWLADRWGIQSAVAIEAGVCLAAVLGGWLFLRSRGRAVERARAD
jgi:MFS family permease